MNFKYFPKLNGLNKITMETTALKLMEEAGELSQAISKFRGLNGEKVNMTEEEVLEKITGELLDVMQVCATMTYVIEEKYDINLDDALVKHLKKLKDRGYVK
ncbi:MazG-like family protein [Haliovirga abyssi]|uniref:Nucleotide pyrophosphohydrolase n=1 Tax=Haliovirga abyssi TaxID=2996794 RepID=A0AAU9DXB7_9FUSO|nr:MazG-like family protein [Haliovirga abyssi]BDU50000.1 nucleotide pyrophosphohydrolase [Haliovirga abyssi]